MADLRSIVSANLADGVQSFVREIVEPYEGRRVNPTIVEEIQTKLAEGFAKRFANFPPPRVFFRPETGRFALDFSGTMTAIYMLGMNYILDKNHQPRHPKSMQELMEFTHEKKIVDQEKLEGGIWVSTVFLGINHNFGSGPPLWFETLVEIDGEDSRVVDRYTTWEQAQGGHGQVVAEFRIEIKERRAKLLSLLLYRQQTQATLHQLSIDQLEPELFEDE